MMDMSALFLCDESGTPLAKIADFVPQDPVENGKLKYRDFFITFEFMAPPKLGTHLTVFDKNRGEQICQFTCIAVHIHWHAEQFIKLTGRHIISCLPLPNG